MEYNVCIRVVLLISLISTAVEGLRRCGKKRIMKECLEGTSFGPKLGAALRTCKANKFSARYGGLFCESKSSCPTMQEVQENYQKLYSKELCVWPKVGFMDNKGRREKSCLKITSTVDF